MKKIGKIKKFLCVVLSAVFCVGVAGCKGDEVSTGESETVTLVPIANPAEISPALGYDYYLAAEPLASAKVKATANGQSPLYVVGDLQALYGGEDGYPQAVLVAKNSFIQANGGWLDGVLSDLTGATEWLLKDTTEIATVVSAVQSHLTEGLTPSLKVGNLSREVIEHCGVRFVPAQADKVRVNTFLSELIGVAGDSAKTVADKFFYVAGESVAQSQAVAQVYMPDGAPALAMAKFMSEGREDCAFHVVDASTIATFVTGANPTADLCVLPLNAASKLLGTGEKYTMLGTVTNGNLFLLSTSQEKIESAEDLRGLAGKKVGTIQINNVPGLTLKLILKKYGLAYSEQGLV